MTEATSWIANDASERHARMSRRMNAIDNGAMLLAGDVGGTKTLLGLFAARPERPSAIEVGEFVTLDYDGLEPMIREFLRRANVERAAHRRRRASAWPARSPTRSRG